MKTYRIQEFAERAGVTIKALHHYDRIGLLQPARTGARYRVYTDRDLDRVDRIAAFKFLGIPLKQIKALLHDGARGLPAALGAQRAALERNRRALDRRIAAIACVERHLDRGGVWTALAPKMFVRAMEMEYGLRPPRPGDPVLPPSRVGPSKLALFRETAAAIDSPSRDERRAELTARWRALVDAETGGDHETRRLTKDAVVGRGEWPDGMRAYVASLYDTDWETFDRVAAYVFDA